MRRKPPQRSLARPEHMNKLYKEATRYYNGDGVKKDWRKAFALTGQAASSGDLDALYALACCYEFGIGTRKNRRRAFEL
jgi:TPR repeat protein